MMSRTGTVIVPTSQVHSGWLKKKGKKRWFILQDNSLYWFAKEQKAVTFQHNLIKGCLELKGYVVAISEKKPHTFIVSNLRDMNYYELTAATDEIRDQWVKHIRAVILKTSEADPNNERPPTDGKRGVLTKKGQERLFVLKRDSLMWFLSKTGSEKKAKGSLGLKDLTVKRGTKGYSFVLQPKVGKAYILFAANQAECDEWMDAVTQAINALHQSQTTVKNGWLEKKGQKRYFVIKNGKLLWFNKMQKEDDVEANGYLRLDTCRVTLVPPGATGKYSLQVISENQKESKIRREYILTATSEAECRDWMSAMVLAGASGDVPQVPSSVANRRSVALSPSGSAITRRPIITTGAEEGSVISGSGLVVTNVAEFRKSYSQKQVLDGEVEVDFMVAEKSGWLDKKGKRRWFVLERGEFAWFDQPRQHQRGEKPNGSIHVKDASVAQIGEIGNGYFVFAIYSATARESEYLLQASSLTDMEDWVVALVLAGANPGKERALSMSDDATVYSERPESLPENDKNGWLEKKGRRRWFVLRNGQLAWYKAVQETEAGLREPAGSLELATCTVKLLEERLKDRSALVISSPTRGEYLLLHKDADEIASWVKALIEKGGASRYRATVQPGGVPQGGGRYFGVSLQQVLAREAAIGSAEPTGIPILVRKCVEHLRQHAMEAEGLFRVSGEQIDIVALKQEFENASDPNTVTFADNIDVHSVSGILKMFFRELTPPLMTFELYSDFMSAAGCVMSEIQSLIERLPPENKILLRYLLHFLYDVAQHGEVNKMRPMNLAIVFSPNLFRSTLSALEVLANSSNAATVTQFLVASAHDLFPVDVTPTPAAAAAATATATATTPESESGSELNSSASAAVQPSSPPAAAAAPPPAGVAVLPPLSSVGVMPAKPLPMPAVPRPVSQGPNAGSRISTLPPPPGQAPASASALNTGVTASAAGPTARSSPPPLPAHLPMPPSLALPPPRSGAPTPTTPTPPPTLAMPPRPGSGAFMEALPGLNPLSPRLLPPIPPGARPLSPSQQAKESAGM